MRELVQEAARVTRELGEDVTFVGAIAVYMYTKTERGSRDLDFAVAHDIEDEELYSKGYVKNQRNGKEVTYTPRGTKIDIYTRDIGGIPVTKIIESAILAKASSGKNSPSIKIANLEVLIYTKYKANRAQDQSDLQEISQIRYYKIDWPNLRSLASSQTEFDQIQGLIKFYHEN